MIGKKRSFQAVAKTVSVGTEVTFGVRLFHDLEVELLDLAWL